MATGNKKPAAPAAPAGSTKALRIVSKSPMGTLRRAGLEFGTEPQLIALADLTADQLAAIEAEPLLDKTEAEIEPAKG